MVQSESIKVRMNGTVRIKVRLKLRISLWISWYLVSLIKKKLIPIISH